MANRRGFTLLEVLLALFLTTVTLTLLLFAMQVNAGVTDKSSRDVHEAQLARALLQRIKDDLLNALSYLPPGTTLAESPGGAGGGAGALGSSGGTSSNNSSGSTSTSSGSSSTGSASSSSGSASSSSSNSDSSTYPVSGGIFGDSQTLQIETSHRPRMGRAALANSEDGQPLSQLSDIRVVTYSLNEINSIGPEGPTASTGEPSGFLYRTDMDRQQFYMAMGEDGNEADGTVAKLGDPEVGDIADLKITYYDGSTANDTWDSNSEGKLPSSVRVAISIRRAAKSSSGSIFGGSSEDRPLVVYGMLVDIPNSAVTAEQIQALAQVDPMKLSSGINLAALLNASSGSTGQ